MRKDPLLEEATKRILERTLDARQEWYERANSQYQVVQEGTAFALFVAQGSCSEPAQPEMNLPRAEEAPHEWRPLSVEDHTWYCRRCRRVERWIGNPGS